MKTLADDLVGKVCAIEYADSAPHEFRYNSGIWNFARVLSVDGQMIKIERERYHYDEWYWLNLACIKSLKVDEWRSGRAQDE